MRIPFTKAHGAGNDFLLTWMNEAPREDRTAAARAICERHTGIGADGWLLVSQPPPGEQERVHRTAPAGSGVHRPRLPMVDVLGREVAAERRAPVQPPGDFGSGIRFEQGALTAGGGVAVHIE